MSNTLSYRGYTTSMTVDPDDKIIVGRVLDIDDILSFQGESVGEFESNFHMVVDDYIAACTQLDSPPEKPASGKIMLRVALSAVPNEVVNLSFERGVSAMAAWREHLGLTQADVATRIGITQAAYAQMECVKKPRKAALEKVAAALGLGAEQLRW